MKIKTPSILFLFFLLCSLTISLSAQENSPPCATTIHPELLEAYRADVSSIEAFSQNRSVNSGGQVPVNFIVIRKDDGSGLNIEQIELDDILDELDDFYAPSNLDFVQCGTTTYIDDTRIYDGSALITSLPNFAYSSSAVNIFLRPWGTSFARFPCYAEILDLEPSHCLAYDNNIWISGTDGGYALYRSMRHEMGHHLGLFHTFGPEVGYTYPVQPEQIDHPYDAPVGKIGRELTIRSTQPVGTVDFEEPNCNEAGDLVCDTPVDCVASPGGVPAYFPDVTDPDCVGPNPWGPDCESGCFISFPDCAVTGNYADYNLHSVVNQPMGTPGKNVMSYHPRECRTELTPGQTIRNDFYYENYRKQQYAPLLCGNLRDEVDFWDTEKGIDKINIHYTHSSDDRICNTFNNSSGDFSGTLHNNTLYSEVTKLGDNPDYSYTRLNWTEEVDVADLISISRHLIGFEPFDNGYTMIAADTDRSGYISTFDMVALQRLVLAYDDQFPAYNQPWLFVPEYIPFDYSISFNTNPFDMLINGIQYQDEVPYISPDWEYSIPNGNNGISGFDAVKLGDVTGSAEPGFTGLPQECLKNVTYQTPSFLFQAQKTISIEVKGYGINNIVGFQGGINLDFDTYELIDIVSSNVPGLNIMENFGTSKLENNELRMLWYDVQNPLNLTDGTVLFKIFLKTKTNANLNATIEKSDEILQNIFYNNNGCQVAVNLEFFPLVGDTRSEEVPAKKINHNQLQCFPNPAKSEVLITIDTSKPTVGNLSIFDLNGKTLNTQEISCISGRNIHYQDLSAFPNGMYWITFNDGLKIYTQRLVKY